MQRFQEAENSTDQLKEKLFELETGVSGSIHGFRVEVTGVRGTIWQNITNIEANVPGMVEQQNALNEKVKKMNECIGAIESQISAFTNQLSQLNRPWWRKLFG